MNQNAALTQAGKMLLEKEDSTCRVANTAERGEFPREVERPLIILPTYNEVDNITRVLDTIMTLPLNATILVVDDSSPDGTSEKVVNHSSFKKNVFLLKRPSKGGLGSAYKEGFKWGLENGHDVCLEMDSDFSHDPKDILRLLKAVDDGADIALGSRYINGISVINWPLHRLLLSLWAGAYTRFFTGMPLSDPTSGFKAIRADVLKRLPDWDIKTEGYGIQIEVNYFAWKNGFTIKEVPIIFTERRNGQSKLGLIVKIESAIRVLQLGVGRIWGQQLASKGTSEP
jgi:dolichol-phosphate mannosyltransferase